MKYWRWIVFVVLVLVTSLSLLGGDKKSVVSSNPKERKVKILGSLTKFKDNSYSQKRLMMIGKLIKNTLEMYHYGDTKIDDKLSKKAFVQYLKKIDYGKQFLLQKDVDELKKYDLKMDDQVVSGVIPIVDKTLDILNERIYAIEKFRKETFKKKFNFLKDESLETDFDKRKYQKDINLLKDHWRKVFKHSIALRYLSLKDEQEEKIKERKKDKKNKGKKKNKKKDKKKEKFKILTTKQLKKKAKKAISKKYKKLFARLLKEDRSDYLENFYNSITNVFDPHTAYMPPKRKEDFDIDISGSLEGIGAVLQEDEAYIKVVKIIPGGAAWREKHLEADDLILAVAQGTGEFVDLTDMKVDDAVRYIRGKKGTVVKLTIKKVDGTIKTISIVRDVVQIGESYAKSSVIFNKKLGIKVGYILVPKFYRDFDNNKQGRNCTEDVRRELELLKKQNVDGVILDLRNNGGGALEDARKMSGLFIKKGPIVQVKGHDGEINIMKDKDRAIVYGGPLIVMTNLFSASASEILAGAMQDYGRAIIVGGEFSHGKGTVQAVLNLNQGPLVSLYGYTIGALKITIQKFYRITGASTQYKGITPDVILPDSYSYSKSREKDLENSLTWDEIEGLSFKQWGQSFNSKKVLLRKRSGERLKKDKALQKIAESVKYLEKRRDETKTSLQLSKMISEIEQNKKIIDKFKDEFKNEQMEVSHYEDSIKMSSEHFKKANKEKWKKDFDKRKTEWVESLQKDAVLSETINILKEMVELSQGKKLTAKN